MKKNLSVWQDDNMEHLFETIRYHSKFCSMCGNKLDLGKRKWHLPFCNKCRSSLIEKSIRR